MYTKGGERMEKLYTIQETADILKTSRDTIYKWIKAEKIAAVKFEGIVRVTESQIKEIMNGGE